MENPHRILKCADILNGCCFLPWWGVYFAWTCPAHSCGTAGTDGAGCVMEGWCSDWEVGGCTVEAQSAFALGVCARLSLLPFWTGKAASAAEGCHSSHKLDFKKERKKMMKTAAVKEKSRNKPAVHAKRLALIYHSSSSRGSYWAVDSGERHVRRPVLCIFTDQLLYSPFIVVTF